MSDSTITFLILAVVVAIFVWDRLPVGIVAVGTALSLWATGVLDYEQVFAGFGDPTVIFIASLFVVSEGHDAAGVTSWAGQELVARIGESRTRLIVLMVLLSVLTVEQAYRGISWTTVVLVGSMISLSTAMVETGAAETPADGLVRIVGDAGPYALLLGLFLLTAALGQLISKMATALIVIPIAISAAADMDVSARSVLMAVAVSAAASLLTPVFTPANVMVMKPGGYGFGDYWKLGLPLLVLFGAVVVLLVPVFWRF